MKRKKQLTIFVYFMLLISLVINPGFVSASVSSQSLTMTVPRYSLENNTAFGYNDLSADIGLEDALGKVLSAYIELTNSGLHYSEPYILTDNTWVVAVFSVLNMDGSVVPYIDVVFVGYNEPESGWIIIAPLINTAQEFNDLLARIPDSLVDENYKAFLYQYGTTGAAVQNFSGHKLPWPSGQPGTVTQKGGTGHENQVDFAIPADVYASKPGTVVFVKESSNHGACNFDVWRSANMVVVQHSATEYTWYVHLAYNSVPVNVGDSVSFGTKIGVEGGTGYSCGDHLHFMASTGHTAWTNPSDPNAAPWATGTTAVDFAEVSWSSMSVGTSYVSQNSGSTPPPPPSCPTSGDVIFYKDKDYSCGGEGANYGYVLRNGTGEQDMPSTFNNKASSVRIRSGWSVKFYEDLGRLGATYCRTSSDSDFSNNTFNDGSAINDRISAFKVYSDSTCGTPPPTCPTSGDMILYKHNNYDCGGLGENSGYVLRNGTGFQNIPSGMNDEASSLRLRSGWSVKLYENADRGGGSVCRSAGDSDFAGDSFTNGVSLNDKVSSLELFSNTTCAPAVADPRQDASVSITGTRVKGTTVYFTISVKNYGALATPAIHPYIEGTNSSGVFWRADGCVPSSAVIQPGETKSFQVQQVATSAGTWTSNGIYLWNNTAGTYWKPLPANGYNQQFSFVVTDPIPAAFGKSSPASGSTSRPTNTSVSWQSSAGATSYRFCFDTINNNTCDSVWLNAGTNTSGNMYGLKTGTTYYWQVRAVNAFGMRPANSGTWWNFTTSSTSPLPAAFGKVSPPKAATGQPTSLRLAWQGTARASDYHFCYDTTPNNTCDTGWKNAGTATGVSISGLSRGVTYYWQIRAVNGSGFTPANEGRWWKFTVN